MTEDRATYATEDERLREESRSMTDRKLDEVLAVVRAIAVQVGAEVEAEVEKTCYNCADQNDRPCRGCYLFGYRNWRPRTTEAQP